MSTTFALLGPTADDQAGCRNGRVASEVLEAAVADGAPDAIAAVDHPGRHLGQGPPGSMVRRVAAATARDEFAIASITKTFTAALVMRLVEQGKMDLDAPLASYLGDLKVDTNGATVRQALEMRAGIADFTAAAAEHIHVDAAHAWTTEEILGRVRPTGRSCRRGLQLLERNLTSFSLWRRHM